MFKPKVIKTFPIKIYFDTVQKKPVGPSFPEQLRASIPVLNILQNGSIIIADRGNKLPPLQMPEGVIEANAEIVVYESPQKKSNKKVKK